MAKFKYNCIKCGAPAEKKPCAKTDGLASLGTWRCPRCGPTKVNRT